jgi:hypothetical protein
MNPTPPQTDELVTQLLLLPDGSVLADNLTPVMASLLMHLGLQPHPASQCRLSRSADPASETQDRRGSAGRASWRSSTHGNTQRNTKGPQ